MRFLVSSPVVAQHRWGFLARRLARGETLVVVAAAAGISSEAMQSLAEEAKFKDLVEGYEEKLRLSDGERAAYRRELIEDGEVSLLEMRHAKAVLAAAKALRRDGGGLDGPSRSFAPSSSSDYGDPAASGPPDDCDPFADYVPKELMGDSFDDGALDDGDFDDGGFDDGALGDGVSYISEASLGRAKGDRPRRLTSLPASSEFSSDSSEPGTRKSVQSVPETAPVQPVEAAHLEPVEAEIVETCSVDAVSEAQLGSSDVSETGVEAESVDETTKAAVSEPQNAGRHAPEAATRGKLAARRRNDIFIGANSANPPDPNHCYWRPEKVPAHHKRGPPGYR